ncbi:tripartite tricarboxylate transporter TctB family protein [Pelomonas sp. KK5]|uniref:tripartite tricarboxylate transporter TctB family protein n=1 Tax=Pelomonas sp. KK5 TaxID=1855730 RepID=UPI00097C3B4B|nr:tripartite tricarboxylate transporter TctB family protein [Pelomonas sp. KK5]
MKLKSQRDFWSGLLFVLIGLAFAWLATGRDFGDAAEPGPGLLPFGLGLLLALLGGLLLFKALAIESERGNPIARIAWRPLLMSMAAIAAFGYGLPRLGLTAAVPGAMLFALLAAGVDDWRALLGGMVLATLLTGLLVAWVPLAPAP